ncbi:winged helix-turn-helix domain-containing protein [Aestuariivirga litoralis]|uniref:winged helix-turn-helix domain-containing protein n=1 Tax=Aestuariivirga litoralis TaxID=2650924 RepID=UPI0018C68832|nr:crosslink repair DNA glycosylase YcaQ family protein [Aestuariivirga litoralis]MBG1231287.1 winged helix-turn-helix domain-containing protein [Aestuariivirga litoralis]
MTPQEARRIALAAQGFTHQDRDKPLNWGHIARTIDDLHLLQIDSVNVVIRSHYLPLFSRLGNYPRDTLDKRTLARTKRHVFECWAHEASLVPLTLHPLMRWRMNRARNGDGNYKAYDHFSRTEKNFLKSTLAHIEKFGPVTASSIPGAGKSSVGWWNWSKGKLALETLFDHGLVTTSHRDGFERIYDLSERVIPAEIQALPTPPEEESFEMLMEMSAQALGIATEIDLRDYFRLPVKDARAALLRLIEQKRLIEVQVKGWPKLAYVTPNVKKARKAGGTALLSPFDPLVWNRDRASRIFNFDYRIEIYTPGPKRKYGYYVLPFLFEDKLVGRVCLKADREAGVLRANQIHIEDGADPSATAQALATELKRMQHWLGLEGLDAASKGNLAKELQKYL